MSSQIPELPGGLALTIPLAIVILVVMVILHELGHFIAAKRSGVKVLEFGIGWPPRLFGRTWRGTLYSLNAIPVGAFVRMLGENDQAQDPDSFSAKPKRSRALILVAGSAMNLLLAPVLFSVSALISDFDSVEITGVAPGSPAEAAGLRPGDRIEQVAGHEVDLPSDVGRIVLKNAGNEIRLGIDRNGAKLPVPIVPRRTHPDDEGPLGVSIRPHLAPAPFTKALARGFTRTAEAVVLVPAFILDLISGSVGLEEVSGPVGIVDAVGQAARRGPEIVLLLAGYITVQLAILNLLPWPGLDGGRLLLLGVEALRGGRRLPAAQEGAINILGILLLLMLVALVTVGDVRRIAGG
ncbi:MAG: M50 family metallopeptidase [Chloroflexi bacterium]|nr:M50 family metallopeptidase [Chloroflexota bacterium]MCY3937010.1 M50 family metallopeptidase [Chloroflexota bacterium]